MTTRPKGIRTWIEIDTKALKSNYETFRQVIGSEVKLMAVAKSNAYGHCLTDYAKTMEKLGVDWLGADSITEAARLRREGIKTPILILGYTLPENLELAAENDISITVSSFDQIEALARIQNTEYRIQIHMKVDTGMHRQGFQSDEVQKACEQIKKLENVEFEGIYTHFAMAKDPAEPAETNEQIAKFKQVVNIVESHGFHPIKHAVATGGALIFPAAHFDMVRIGIGLYGLWPSLEARNACEGKIKLMPALSWKTIISEIKNVPKGEGIGYDLTEKLASDSRIAILPIGYWHGIRRSYSSTGHVLIHGARAKVLGRVSMDMIVVDITDISDVQVGDTVTLVGQDGGDEITIDEIAAICQTSNYEIVTQINSRIKRVYQ